MFRKAFENNVQNISIEGVLGQWSEYREYFQSCNGGIRTSTWDSSLTLVDDGVDCVYWILKKLKAMSSQVLKILQEWQNYLSFLRQFIKGVYYLNISCHECFSVVFMTVFYLYFCLRCQPVRATGYCSYALVYTHFFTNNPFLTLAPKSV